MRGWVRRETAPKVVGPELCRVAAGQFFGKQLAASKNRPLGSPELRPGGEMVGRKVDWPIVISTWAIITLNIFLQYVIIKNTN